MKIKVVSLGVRAYYPDDFPGLEGVEGLMARDAYVEFEDGQRGFILLWNKDEDFFWEIEQKTDEGPVDIGNLYANPEALFA